jgi:hypothetical protein
MAAEVAGSAWSTILWAKVYIVIVMEEAAKKIFPAFLLAQIRVASHTSVMVLVLTILTPSRQHLLVKVNV